MEMETLNVDAMDENDPHMAWIIPSHVNLSLIPELNSHLADTSPSTSAIHELVSNVIVLAWCVKYLIYRLRLTCWFLLYRYNYELVSIRDAKQCKVGLNYRWLVIVKFTRWLDNTADPNRIARQHSLARFWIAQLACQEKWKYSNRVGSPTLPLNKKLQLEQEKKLRKLYQCSLTLGFRSLQHHLLLLPVVPLINSSGLP